MSNGINEIITTTAAALMSGALGYAFREYRNRVTPFFQITAIHGSITRRSDGIELSPEITQKLEKTFFIKPLSLKCELGEAWDHWDRSDDMKRYWPEISQIVDEILSSTNDDTLTLALARAFNKNFFDQSLMLLLVNNRIIFPKLPLDSAEKIHAFFEDENNGMVWFDFPNAASNFGRGLKHSAIKARSEPFIQLICHLHHESIFNVMRQFKDILDSEYKAAMEVHRPLEQIVDENSRWLFICYLANLSNNPIIIENKASVKVSDQISFSEPAYLTLIKPDSDGSLKLSDTSNPVVVKTGDDVVFGVITEKTQSEMKLGNALRETFNRKQGKCQVSVQIRRVGLLKNQKYQSQFSPFISTEKNKVS